MKWKPLSSSTFAYSAGLIDLERLWIEKSVEHTPTGEEKMGCKIFQSANSLINTHVWSSMDEVQSVS